MNPKDIPPLLTLGDPRLAQPSDPVRPETIRTMAFQTQVELLKLALDVFGANGVAAPQLGWFYRAFVMRDPSGTGEVITWVNPEVTATSETQVWYWEGCLSVPGYKAFIGRPAAITVKGLNDRGEPQIREFTDWEAHLFQHENDHLDGMLFPYRLADPRHMITSEALEQRKDWPEDWPAPGAKTAPVRMIAPPPEN